MVDILFDAARPFECRPPSRRQAVQSVGPNPSSPVEGMENQTQLTVSQIQRLSPGVSSGGRLYLFGRPAPKSSADSVCVAMVPVFPDLCRDETLIRKRQSILRERE